MQCSACKNEKLEPQELELGLIAAVYSFSMPYPCGLERDMTCTK